MNSTNVTFALNVTCPKRIVSYMPTIKVIFGYYIFPWLLIIGVTGNILNLLVLNSKGMRTKTNTLLSAMAVADLCFLILMLPSELQVFESIASKDWYRSFLAYHKMKLTFASNWFATSSTWMALAVTAERVFAIKMPLHAKFYWTNARIVILIFTIFISNCLIHLYNVFWFRVIVRPLYCTDGITYAFSAYMLIPVNETSSAFRYVQISRIFVPHVSVTLPFFVLFIFNIFLLYYLHRNRLAIANATNAPQLRQNEQKVALTVAVIVITFMLCSAPSVVLYLYDVVMTFVFRSSPYTVTFFNLTILSNHLVVLSKASNFLLYCSASSHFRRRLRRIFCKKKRGQTRGSSRGSTSQRRTTLTTLFANALAELQFYHPHQHRNSADTCCAIAATRSRSNKSVDLAYVNGRKQSRAETRRYSHQHQRSTPNNGICGDRSFLLELRRFSGPSGQRRNHKQVQ